MQSFMRDIIYILLDLFISNDVYFAILYGSMFYIYIKIFIWNTHHTTNVQLCGQLIQTMMMFDIKHSLAWTQYELLEVNKFEHGQVIQWQVFKHRVRRFAHL